MFDKAEYVGPIRALKGKKAWVSPDETYENPLEKRTLKAKFCNPDLIHPVTNAKIGRKWMKYQVTDFYLMGFWRDG